MRVMILLSFVMVLGVAACQKTEQVKKVSFTLGQSGKPLTDEEIAIVPLECDKLQMSDAKRLGLGKTDSQGAPSCDLGNVVFETFEFSGTSR